jgi:hypothetical protein
LDGSNRHGIDNVFCLASAGEIIRWLVEALQDWSDSCRPSQSFGKFISNVSRLQIRENQDIRTTPYRRAWSFGLSH